MARNEFVNVLRDRITVGEFEVGTRLPSERDLADRYQISRSVVREALRTLAEQGFVSIEAGRGAFVRAPSADDAASMIGVVLRRQRVTARHVVSARRLIEGEAASLAAAHRTDDDLARMSRALEGIGSAGSLLDQVEADLSLHLAIVRAARNPVLEAMFGSIVAFTAEVMLRSLADPDVVRDALPQHHEILAAIGERDGDRARAVMIEHLEVAERRFGEDLDRPLEQVARGRLLSIVGPQADVSRLEDRARSLVERTD